MSEFIKGIKQGQKYFGETIAAIINLILLSIVYIIGVGITSIAAKTFKKKFLDIKINKKTKSYWQDLNLKDKPIEEYYRQF